MKRVFKLNASQEGRKAFCLRPSFVDALIENKLNLVVIDSKENQMLLDPLYLAVSGTKITTKESDYPLVEYTFYPNQMEIEMDMFNRLYYELVKDDWLTELEIRWLNKVHWTWFNTIGHILCSDEFLKNITYANNRRDKVTVYPKQDDVFKVFEQPINQINVVILGQDPYPGTAKNGKPYATGYAFANPMDVEKASSLQIIEDTLKREFNYPTDKYLQNDLGHWKEQGILLLNAALTVEKGKIGSHADYWKTFIQEVLTELDKTVPGGIVFVFMGKIAGSFSSCIYNNPSIVTSHPNSAAYGNGIWNTNVFQNINQELRNLRKQSIKWVL